MEQCLHQWFVADGQLRNSCDFHDGLIPAHNAVYEVIRIIHGKPLFLKAHLERLYESLQLTAMNHFPKPESVRLSIKTLIQANGVHTGNLKLLVGKGSTNSSAQIFAWLIPYFYPSEDMYLNGVNVSLFTYQRKQPNAKLVNPELKSAASGLMEQQEAYELLLHHNGLITEGSRSNVFFIIGNTIRTAPDNLVLKGITRDKVLEIIKINKIPLELEAVGLNELERVEAAFLCGTSPRVLPIRSIDHQYYFDVQNQTIKDIRLTYDQMIADDIDSFVWE
ncbi:MAG: aminotransferase class IV family protein [Bacteroidetes bacterium]|nr:aminotransferase class IV family protein [Bacteroidota bacterium]